MGGKHGDAGDSQHQHTGKDDGHTAALQDDAYKPRLNYSAQDLSYKGKPAQQCDTGGPKLAELTIDVPNVHVKDEPRRDASAAERLAASKREVPVSNEHYREIVKKGAEFVAINGSFEINMRHALDEANQSDKSKKSGHKHVDDLLKVVNKELCGSSYTLGRQGNKVLIYDTHYNEKPSGKWNLDRKAWER